MKYNQSFHALLIGSLLLAASAGATSDNASASGARSYKPARKVTVNAYPYPSEEVAKQMLEQAVASLPATGDMANKIGRAEVLERRDLACKVQKISDKVPGPYAGKTLYTCAATLTVREFGPPVDPFAGAAPGQGAKPSDAAGSTRQTTSSDNSLLQMTQQLDQLDKMDFDAAIEDANACTRSRNYACTEKQLAKAAKYARGTQDKYSMQLAQQNLAAEKEREAEERQRRREEEERLEREEQERKEEEWRQARRRREAEDDDDNSGSSIGMAILQGIAKAQADAAPLTAIHNNMVRNLNAQVAQRQREQAEQRAREIEQQNRERRQREEELRDRREAQQRSEQQRLAQLDQQRYAQQREQERIVQQELERVQREQERARREAELAQQAREQAARKEEERRRAEEQRQQRERERAEQQAKKEAEKLAAIQARRDYLQAVLRGTRLLARKCPDGEGKYYLVGKRPSIKPEVVSCIDVHYHAYCPGNVVGTRGVAKNFLGAGTDCFFGDAVNIDPKPGCPVDQVHVEATEVRACGE